MVAIYLKLLRERKIDDMEVKINREIRNYTESIFFGLSLRQFIFSILACGVAVILYFVLKRYLGIETLSWVCILGAAPFAAIGFVKYNGMTAEELIKAYIRSELLTPKKLKFDKLFYNFKFIICLINKNYRYL